MKIVHKFTDGYNMQVGIREDGMIMWACDCKELCGGKRRWRKSTYSTEEFRNRFGLEILRLVRQVNLAGGTDESS
jgi:hypothetical protein